MSWTTYESPLGPLTLIGSDDGLRHVHFPGHGPRREEIDHDAHAFSDTVRQLEEYFAGDRRTFELTLDLGGTELQRRVWNALQQIPYGQTTTYGAIARTLELAPSTRAPAAQIVGWAVGRTPTPIVVPCHRVLAADGALTGYLGGLQRKQALLALEAGDGDPHTQWAQQQLALL